MEGHYAMNYISAISTTYYMPKCLIAFNTTKHTYSRSAFSFDSRLLQELGALDHREDLSQHS